MATVDLWPDEIATDGGLEGPTVVLREQAALLGQKTKNLVEAEVETFPELGHKDSFIDGFSIVSNIINYRYPLFQVNYPLDFYPAFVVWDGLEYSGGGYSARVGTSPARQVNSREELEETLKEIFTNEKTVRIIQALHSRSRE